MCGFTGLNASYMKKEEVSKCFYSEGESDLRNACFDVADPSHGSPTGILVEERDV
jgi:hypothetical protein